MCVMGVSSTRTRLDRYHWMWKMTGGKIHLCIGAKHPSDAAVM